MNKLFEYFSRWYKKVFNIDLIEKYERRIHSLEQHNKYLVRKNTLLLEMSLVEQLESPTETNISIRQVAEESDVSGNRQSEVFEMSDEDFMKVKNGLRI